MSHHSHTIEYHRNERLSLSAYAIILIFFLVTSQVFILSLPDVVTQLFRPLLIVMLLIHMRAKGSVRNPARIFAFFVAVHAVVVLFFYRELWNQDNFLNGGAVALFFLMFSVAIGVNWGRRELRGILIACFVGCFVCAVALLYSNDPTDLNAATAGHLDLMGTSVNRNKNAYQYSFGSIIGMVYLLKGKKNYKPIIFLMEAVTVYALLYSQCRGAFFSFVGGATILFAGLLLEIRKKNSGKALIYTVLLVVAYIVIYHLLKNSDLSRLIDAESKSGRDEGIEAAWNLFLNSDWFGKIFGNGFGFESMQTGEIGAHNVFVGYLVSMGMIGSGLTALLFISSARCAFGAGAYALIVAAFLKTMFEGADYNVFIPLILGVVLCNYTRVTGRDYYELFGKS